MGPQLLLYSSICICISLSIFKGKRKKERIKLRRKDERSAIGAIMSAARKRSQNPSNFIDLGLRILQVIALRGTSDPLSFRHFINSILQTKFFTFEQQPSPYAQFHSNFNLQKLDEPLASSGVLNYMHAFKRIGYPFFFFFFWVYIVKGIGRDDKREICYFVMVIMRFRYG